MSPSEQRRLIVALGGAAAVVIIAVTAAVLLRGPRPAPVEPSTVAGALQVQVGKQARLDPNAPLRCFVNGQYVGMQTTAQCAAKNGVAPGAMDVGVDQSGAPAAAPGGAMDLKPLPVTPAEPVAQLPPAAEVAANEPPPAAPAAQPATPGAADCQRITGRGPRSEGSMSLGACVRTLFQGRCLDPGETIDGRWGSQTLRLEPGQVTISRDNGGFRPLASQDSECNFPPG